MGYIILNTDRDDEMNRLRTNMRHSMIHGGTMPMMRGGDKTAEHYYKMGYRHAVEDWEDENEEHYRRMRDARGRFV